jgi:hypothetical protein
VGGVEKLNSKEAFRLLDADGGKVLDVLVISTQNLDGNLGLGLLVSEF